MKRLAVAHPCDRPKVRDAVLRFAEHVASYHPGDGGSSVDGDIHAYLAKRNDLAIELEWAIRAPMIRRVATGE